MTCVQSAAETRHAATVLLSQTRYFKIRDNVFILGRIRIFKCNIDKVYALRSVNNISVI
jgi:hypothetical protein